MSTEIKVRVNKELDLVTYAEHWHTANCLLDRAKAERKGSYHQYVASLTFTAFTLEAFLNHMGEELFAGWEDLEQLNVRGKIYVLSDKLGINVDYGKMPWQVVPEIVAFRNKVAHGKNERLFEEVVLPQEKYDRYLNDFLKSKWQKLATLDNTERVMRNVAQICKIVWEAAGHEEWQLFRHGSQFGSASV